jgi:type IV pilus assembly protein PilN
MIKINLVAGKKPTVKAPQAAGPKLEFGGSRNLLLVGMLLLGVAVAGGWWWSLNGQRASLKQRHAEADRELERLVEVRAKADEYKKKKDTLVRKIDLITELKKKQEGPVHILDQISRNLPDFVWLDSMGVNNGQITLSGKATSYNAVTNFYNNLAASGHFTTVTMGKVFAVKEGVTFGLSCGFAGLGGAEAAVAKKTPDAKAKKPSAKPQAKPRGKAAEADPLEG